MDRKINVPDKINNYMVRYLSEKFPLEFCAEPILVYFMKEIEDEEQKKIIRSMGEDVSDAFNRINRAENPGETYAIFFYDFMSGKSDFDSLFKVQLPHSLAINPLFNTDDSVDRLSDYIFVDGCDDEDIYKITENICSILDSELGEIMLREIDIQDSLTETGEYVMANIDNGVLISEYFIELLNKTVNTIEETVITFLNNYEFYFDDDDKSKIETGIIQYYTNIGLVYHKIRFIKKFASIGPKEYGYIMKNKKCIVETTEIMTTMFYPGGL